MTNYHPISLTSIIGQMLESITARRIRDHVEKTKVIQDSQNGFTKGRSYIIVLLLFFGKVYEVVDNDENYDVIFPNMSKAFNRIYISSVKSKIIA